MKQRARIVVDLAFGDAGKGTMTEYFCRTSGSNLVVRFNGGPQAAHNVVMRDGRHHTFAQFGSGSFDPGVKTLLSRFMFWSPTTLAHEAVALSVKLREQALDRHFIDERAIVITPFHVAMNRIHERMRGERRHGSCGMGHGDAVADSIEFPDDIIRAGDLLDRARTTDRLRRIQRRKLSTALSRYGHLMLTPMPTDIYEMVAQLHDRNEPSRVATSWQTMANQYYHIISADDARAMIRTSSSPVFEGAQGMLLHEWHGFHPYTTWSDTSQKNALELLAEAGFTGETETVGVIRSYATRHGAGPLMTEHVGHVMPNPLEHNVRGDLQGEFRTGCFDVVALKYAVECVRAYGGLSSIALTHLDIFNRQARVPYCDSYIDRDGNRIGTLVPQFRNDLGYQEALQRQLSSVSAQVSGEVHSPTELAREIRAITNIDSMYYSFGPRFDDKQMSL